MSGAQVALAGLETTEAEVPEGYKKCHDCGQILPETEEYFLRYWSKQQRRYYYKCHCRECGKIRSKRWREENSARYKEYYTQRATTEKAREANRAYIERNKEKVAERKRKYREAHRAQIAEYDRSKRATPEGREHANAMTRRWRANNKGYVAEYNKAYSKNHTEYFVQAGHKRNARKNQLKSTFTAKEWDEAKAEFGHACAYCGKPSERLQQDHFIPLSAGGEYTKANIIPACKSCNCSKHNSLFAEWYKRQPFYSAEKESHILSYIEEQKEGE